MSLKYLLGAESSQEFSRKKVHKTSQRESISAKGVPILSSGDNIR